MNLSQFIYSISQGMKVFISGKREKRGTHALEAEFNINSFSLFAKVLVRPVGWQSLFFNKKSTVSPKVYIYGLCDVFYDGYYIQGIYELFGKYEFNISKFPVFRQGTFAVIIENDNYSKKIIIDSKDSTRIDAEYLKWCDVYGKINLNQNNLPPYDQKKLYAIGPSFGVKIWNICYMFYYLILNFIRFRRSIENKREFAANYWRQYKRLRLKKYMTSKSSSNDVFFINSIWKKETQTNSNRALFIEICQSLKSINFEGGFVKRRDGDNFGYDHLLYPKKIPLHVYIKKIKNSAIVFNTPAVLSCHGWKLAEFLALGKAIISTNHFNTLPNNLIHNKHLIYVNNGESIKNAIEELITNADLKKQLEFESRKYFDNFLAPQKVIMKLTESC